MLIDVSSIFSRFLLGANLPVLESEEVSARLLENPRESWEGVFRGTGEPRGIFRELITGLWPVVQGVEARVREPEVRAVQYLSLSEAFGNGRVSVELPSVWRMISEVRDSVSFVEPWEQRASKSESPRASVPLSEIYQLRASSSSRRGHSLSPTRQPYESRKSESKKEGVKRENPIGLFARALARRR